MPGAHIRVVRLRASLETLVARVEDVLVETDGRTIATIAREIAERSGWLAAADG